jgi:Protein of unknown function (DUF998)
MWIGRSRPVSAVSCLWELSHLPLNFFGHFAVDLAKSQSTTSTHRLPARLFHDCRKETRMSTAVATTHAEVLPRNATLTIALAALFIALIVALHLVRPDLDPSGHMLSEYALGPFGWVMTGAFYALAASYLALLILLRPQLRGITGIIGMVCLFIAAVGAAMGGLFPMDPLSMPPDRASTSATLHGVAALLGIPGTLLAATFINWTLSRQFAWQRSRRLLAWTAFAAWLTLIAFAVSMVLLVNGVVSLDLRVGWQNRVLMGSHIAWVILIAHRAGQLGR